MFPDGSNPVVGVIAIWVFLALLMLLIVVTVVFIMERHRIFYKEDEIEEEVLEGEVQEEPEQTQQPMKLKIYGKLPKK